MNKHYYLSLAAGLVMSIPASVDNSSSWREENTLAGMPGAGAMPTTLSVSCPSAPSVQLWVSETFIPAYEDGTKEGGVTLTNMLFLFSYTECGKEDESLKKKKKQQNCSLSWRLPFDFSRSRGIFLSWKNFLTGCRKHILETSQKYYMTTNESTYHLVKKSLPSWDLILNWRCWCTSVIPATREDCSPRLT
jgi:hypothetical protein